MKHHSKNVFIFAKSKIKSKVIYSFNDTSDLKEYIKLITTLHKFNGDLIKSILSYASELKKEKTTYTDEYSNRCLNRALSLFESNNTNKRKKASSIEKRILSLIKKRKAKESNDKRLKVVSTVLKSLEDENSDILKVVKYLRKLYGDGEYSFQSKDAFGRINSD